MRRWAAANRRTRSAFTLLEVILAAAITATLMVASFMTIHTAFTVWDAHRVDLDAQERGHAVLRYIVRALRQADTFTAISAANSAAGDITYVTATGVTQRFYFSVPNLVYFQVQPGPVTTPLAQNITGLNFVGYRSDGVTATNDPAQIQSVKCTVTYPVPRGGGVTRSLSSFVWMRSW